MKYYFLFHMVGKKVLFTPPPLPTLEWSGKNKILFSLPPPQKFLVCSFPLGPSYIIDTSLKKSYLRRRNYVEIIEIRRNRFLTTPLEVSVKMIDFCRMLRYGRLEETDLSYHMEQTGPSRNANIYGFQQCPYFTIVRETAPCRTFDI